ncbi:hypothetical protein BC833DRAFT_576493 [Globomyces pollinis-pini]|nr:hypothetical protein BC833DRAFT_576493 [Globomyces pollinis-pini]
MGCAPSTQQNATTTKSKIANQVFDKFDQNRSGSIDKREFQMVLAYLGYRVKNDQELDLDFKLLDLSGDGKICRDEFCKWYTRSDKLRQLQWPSHKLKLLEELNESFKRYDKDDSGILEREEFRQVYRDLIYKFPSISYTCEELLSQLDTTRDGKVERTEFVRFMMKFTK